MPNFDRFERMTRFALAGELTPTQAAAEMAAVYDASRPRYAKSKSERDLELWIIRARGALAAQFSPDESFTTSENNAEGKDLFATRAGRHVELKSPDGRTDANVGVASIEWALDDSSRRLAHIMKEGMQERRGIWIDAGDPSARDAAVHSSKLWQMRQLLDYFESRIHVGGYAGPRLSHYARCVAVGLTKLTEIRSSFGQAEVAEPLLLVADWDEGLMTYEQRFLPNENIRIDELTGSDESARVSLRLRGEESMRFCLIYPHFKNSYRHDAVTIPASAWVKNACFHVWIE